MINLLPLEIRQKEKLASRVYALISVYIIIGSLIALASAGVWTYRFVLDSRLSDKQGQLSSLESAAKVNSDVLSQAAFIKNRLDAQTTYSDSTDWADMLNRVASYTPAAVQLTDLHLARDANATTVGLNGLANSRRDIVLFKDKLNSSDEFTQAEITAINDREETSSQAYSFTIQAVVKENQQ